MNMDMQSNKNLTYIKMTPGCFVSYNAWHASTTSTPRHSTFSCAQTPSAARVTPPTAKHQAEEKAEEERRVAIEKGSLYKSRFMMSVSFI
jgi:hypothetical protein